MSLKLMKILMKKKLNRRKIYLTQILIMILMMRARKVENKCINKLFRLRRKFLRKDK